MNSAVKRTLKWLAVSVCVLAVICAGLWVGVHTRAGGSAAADLLSAAFSRGETSVKISGLDILLPHRFGFEKLTVGDGHGEWLAVDEAFLRWDPWSLVRGEIRVLEMGAASIQALRVPEAPGGEGEASGRAPEASADVPWHLLGRVSVSSASFQVISLEEPVIGMPLVFRLDASLTPAAERSGAAFSFDIERMDGPGGHVRITAEVDASTRTLALDGRISDPPGGVASTLAGRPLPVEASISGTGPLSMWAGAVDATVGDLAAVDLDLTLTTPGEVFKVEGNGDAAVLAGVTGRAEPERIEVSFGAALSGNGGITLHGLKLAHRDAEFTARGAFDPAGGALDAAFSLGVRDVGGLIPSVPPGSAGDVEVEGRLGGTITRPVLNAEMTGTGISAFDFAADRVTGSLDAVFDRGAAGPGALDVVAAATALGAVFPGGISFPEDEVSVKGDIRLTTDGAVSGNGEAAVGSWFSARLRGSFSSGRELEAEGAIEATDLSAASGLAGVPLAGASRLDFRVRRTGAEPLFVRVDGTAEQALLTGLVRRPWPGGELQYRGTLKLDENNRLHLTDATVADDSFRLTGAASLLPSDRSFSGNLDLRAPDLSQFSTVAATPLSGSVLLEVKAEGKPGGMTAEVACEVSGADAGGFPVDRGKLSLTARGWFPDAAGTASVDLASGPHRFHLNTRIRNDRERTDFDGISLKGPGGEIQGRLGLARQTMLADGRLEYRIEDPGPLAAYPLKGQGSGEIRLFDDGKEQKAAFTLKGSGIDTAFVSVAELEAAGEATGLFPPRLATATCTVSGLKAGEVLVSSATATGKMSGLDRSVTLQADGTYRTAFSSRVAASLSAAPGSPVLLVSDLEHVHGGIPVRLQSPAGVEFAGGKISVKAVSLSIGDGTLRGSAVLEGPIPELDVSFQRLPIGLAAALGYDAGRGSLSGEIHVSPSAEDRLLRLDARVEGFRPPGPARDALPELDAEVHVEAGKAHIEGGGEVGIAGKNPVAVQFRVPMEYRGLSVFPVPDAGGAIEGRLAWAFDVQDLQALGLPTPGDLSGRARLEIEVDGTAGSPEMKGSLHVEEGAYRDPGIGTVIENIAMSFSAHTLPTPGADRIAMSGTVSGISASPFELGAELPFVFSVAPFAFGLPGEGGVEGFVRGDVDLAMIPAAFSLDRNYLEGLMKLDFDLAGTLARPLFTGSAHLSRGYFEDVRTGTVLEDIVLEVEASPPRIEIVRGQARAGRDGRVLVGGRLDAASGEAVSYTVTLELEDAALLRRDDAQAVLDGALTLTGTGREASVTGTVLVDRAEIMIPDRVGQDIPQLEVVEIHRDGAGEPETLPAGGSGPFPVSLDLKLESPGRLFVAGRGLDSEWKGNLHVEGVSPDIRVTGRFSLVRGYFSLLGKRFTLTRGTIDLGGPPGSPPVIDVEGQASSGGMTATVTVSGPATSPSIELSSSPPYPSDEILARVLFGRSLDSVTPFQALQIAQAARTLAGGGGLGVVGRTRKMLGIDQLEVMQSDEQEGATSIRAGKYIGDKIYLQVEQGVGADTSKASVEVELTPNLSLETEMGADSRGGVGIKWRWDY